MDRPDAQITDTAYDPDADLRGLLEDLASVEVSYHSDQEIDLPGGLSAIQREYEMVFEDAGETYSLEGTETTASIGMFISLQGNLGFASGIILHHAVMLGEPTQIYTDENVPSDPAVDQYQDLTAEWYRPVAVEKGFPAARLEKRPIGFETTEVTLAELEKYAEIWLSLE